MRINKRWFIIFSGIMIMSFCFSFLFFKEVAWHNGASPLFVSEGQKPRLTITEKTEIKTKIIYEKTGQTEVGRIKTSADMVGLTKEDLARLYNGWTIEKFTPEQICLTLVVKDQADGVKKDRFCLGIKDGYVVIYTQKPDKKLILKEKTKIAAAKLPQQEVKDLERGIIAEEEQEMLEVLEGLAGYSDE